MEHPYRGVAMQVEQRWDRVCVCMAMEAARSLLQELDKWPDLPEVEQDLVDALKEFLQEGRS